MNYKILFTLLAAIMLLTLFSGCSEAHTAISISDTLSLAERYLSEMNYEQAIIEFDKILSVEPKNVDAYLGKEEAYIALEDTENAIKVLETGYEKTSDERIKSKLDELLGSGGALSQESAEGSHDASIEFAFDGEASGECEFKYYVDGVIQEEMTEARNIGLSDRFTWSFSNSGLHEYSVKVCSPDTDKEEILFDCVVDFTAYAEDGEPVKIWKQELNQGIFRNLTVGTEDEVIIDGQTYKLDTKELSINSNLNDDDLKEISKLKSLESLNLSSTPIKDLSFISELVNLKQLYLCYDEITDISPLSSLKQLNFLCLSENSISDISPLSELTGLETLSLSFNDITDLSPVRSLTNLRSLNVWSNNISDVSCLTGLTKLTELILYYNNITDISSLGNLTNIKLLNLGCNDIYDISALSNMTELRHLVLVDTKVSDISALMSLNKLEYLNLVRAVNNIPHSDLKEFIDSHKSCNVVLYN